MAARSRAFPAGSLVFFAGRSWISRAIALRTCSWRQLLSGEWISHVGLVIHRDGQTQIVESTTQVLPPCLVAGRVVSGVQVHDLADRLREYDGAIWVARPLRSQLSAAASKKLTALAEAHCGESYDLAGCLVSGLAQLRKRWPWQLNPHHFFCSELSAWLLRQIEIDVVPKKSPTGLVWPAGLARVCRRHGQFEGLESWRRPAISAKLLLAAAGVAVASGGCEHRVCPPPEVHLKVEHDVHLHVDRDKHPRPRGEQ